MSSTALSIVAVLFCFLEGTLLASPSFVGSSKCIDCHQTEYKAWQGSHHERAMDHASPSSVRGNFNNASIQFEDKTNRFFKKGNEFWVSIAGPDKQLTEYQIKYTFGFEPLQQYMVEFPDGRVQLIPFAWDTRTLKEGGQRWFHLYPEQTEKHQEFFWTNTGQNWNFMCADCHSTNVNKNFDFTRNKYTTTFSEINVACEACHGAGEDHLKWASKPNKKELHSGFKHDLSKAVSQWSLKAGDTTMTAGAIHETQQTLACAKCHSRHLQISDKDPLDTGSFGDRYLLHLINSPMYFPDGQIHDEAFVYGSFLQSKMHAKGVSCTNCHDAHSAKLSIPKEQVCLQCHTAEAYATPKHHHHQSDSTGAQCINCHMPETTYMQVDNRRDHGWHSPNAGFSQKLGTPDACLKCHTNKTVDWSAGTLSSWYPNKGSDEKPFAPVFAALDQGQQNLGQPLSHIAQNKAHAPIIRASALARMINVKDPNTLIAIARGVKNADENIRVGAIRGATHLALHEKWRILSPLLKDKVLSVRTETARVLVSEWQKLTTEQRNILKPALDNYLDIQEFNNDRGFAHTNKANVFMHQGHYDQAIQSYKNSIRINPYYLNAYVNLAELYRRLKNNDASLKTLTDGNKSIPNNGHLKFNLGLAHIRNKQKAKASVFFDQATLIEPENPRYLYVHGLLLEASDLDKSQKLIRQAYDISQAPQFLYALCEIQIRHQLIGARKTLNELKSLVPKEVHEQLQQQFNNTFKTVKPRI